MNSLTLSLRGPANYYQEYFATSATTEDWERLMEEEEKMGGKVGNRKKSQV